MMIDFISTFQATTRLHVLFDRSTPLLSKQRRLSNVRSGADGELSGDGGGGLGRGRNRCYAGGGPLVNLVSLQGSAVG